MVKIRTQNIIIFNATKSNEKCHKIKSFFEGSEYNCHRWQDLFSVNDENNIMILPMLIKKIPTFDFAIILSDSTDILEQEIKNMALCEQKIDPGKILEQRIEYIKGETKKRFVRKYVMRDNVLFECALCIMALGTDRVILLREENVTIPDDLTVGFGNDVFKMGIETIEYNADNLNEKLDNLKNYVAKKAEVISPIVIGASIAIADGYLSNFILRFWENINNEFYDIEDKKNLKKLDPQPDVSKIHMKIYIPKDIIYENLGNNILDYYMNNKYKQGKLIANSFREVEFRYKIIGDEVIIFDYPSTLTTSFDTVKDILNLSADEKDYDKEAEIRFLRKERDLFKFTLKRLLNRESLISRFNRFSKYTNNKNEMWRMLELMDHVEIIEEDPYADVSIS